MRGLLFGFLLAAMVSLPAGAAQYPTIVGSWYDPVEGVGDCSTYWGMHIEPLGLLSGETRCDFDTVRRDGWQVTWTGQCMFSGSLPEKLTVIAVERRGTLFMDFGGHGDWGSGLKRCPVH